MKYKMTVTVKGKSISFDMPGWYDEKKHEEYKAGTIDFDQLSSEVLSGAGIDYNIFESRKIDPAKGKVIVGRSRRANLIDWDKRVDRFVNDDNWKFKDCCRHVPMAPGVYVVELVFTYGIIEALNPTIILTLGEL